MATDSEGLHAIINTTSQDLKADIVFVHGLGGASHSTWQFGDSGKENGYFWPLELGKAMPQCAVWSIGYAAGFTGLGNPGMIIRKRAGSVAHQLSLHGIGKRPVVFIAHSMGGLIVKSLVVTSQLSSDPDRKRLVQNIRGIVFCATPHRGSAMATAAKILALMAGGAQAHVREMTTNAEELDLLHDEFLAWHKENPISVESYAESIGLFRKGLFGRPVPLGLVVERASANAGIGQIYDVDADHLTIVKPSPAVPAIYTPVCIGVERFIKNALTGGAEMNENGLLNGRIQIQIHSVSPNLSERVNYAHQGKDTAGVNVLAAELQALYEADELRDGLRKAETYFSANALHPNLLKHVLRFNMRDHGWTRIREIIRSIDTPDLADDLRAQCQFALFECDLRQAYGFRHETSKYLSCIEASRGHLNRVPAAYKEQAKYHYLEGRWHLEMWWANRKTNSLPYLTRALSSFSLSFSLKAEWWTKLNYCVVLKLLNRPEFDGEAAQFAKSILVLHRQKPLRSSIIEYCIIALMLTNATTELTVFLGQITRKVSPNDFEDSLIHKIEIIYYSDKAKQRAFKSIAEEWIRSLHRK